MLGRVSIPGMGFGIGIRDWGQDSAQAIGLSFGIGAEVWFWNGGWGRVLIPGRGSGFETGVRVKFQE
ncbi:hypothetical protein TIFTF001_015248 [Ficus carica]|uniref:Uncharacterized protein n=1 Tax=Ficus carica TaxID=3494 RepID=A0AA88A6T6_FICCA|nr:hypothetical protein TIFTF001_015248 [Ficus carica]